MYPDRLIKVLNLLKINKTYYHILVQIPHDQSNRQYLQISIPIKKLVSHQFRCELFSLLGTPGYCYSENPLYEDTVFIQLKDTRRHK